MIPASGLAAAAHPLAGPRGRPWILAHRGATHRYTENTLPAFQAALATAADGIETDLRLSRDEHIVLYHDADLQRLAGRPRAIGELPLHRLLRIPLHGGGRMATLPQLWTMAAGRVLLNLEIKEVAVGKPLVHFLSSRRQPLLLTSYHVELLQALRRQLPAATVGPIFDHLERGEIAAIARDGYRVLCLAEGACTGQHVAACKEHHIDLVAFTVNTPRRALELARSGVRGLITDHPTQLLAAFNDR